MYISLKVSKYVVAVARRAQSLGTMYIWQLCIQLLICRFQVRQTSSAFVFIASMQVWPWPQKHA